MHCSLPNEQSITKLLSFVLDAHIELETGYGCRREQIGLRANRESFMSVEIFHPRLVI